MATIIFGSNPIQSYTDFAVIGIDSNGKATMAGYGPPIVIPSVWITIENGLGFLNAEIKDADNEVVLQINKNHILINKDNIYKATISKDIVIVINQYGETALELKNLNGTIICNADLYIGNEHVVANDNGTIINPSEPSV